MQKPFDAYEISPVIEDENGTAEPVNLDEFEASLKGVNADRHFWSLYGHLPEGGVECVGDYTCYRHAADIYERITQCEAPKDEGRYAVLRPNAQSAGLDYEN